MKPDSFVVLMWYAIEVFVPRVDSVEESAELRRHFVRVSLLYSWQRSATVTRSGRGN